MKSSKVTGRTLKDVVALLNRQKIGFFDIVEGKIIKYDTTGKTDPKEVKFTANEGAVTVSSRIVLR